MKIRNKIIALMISLIAIPTFAIAKDGPYIGVKAAKIDIDYKTVDNVDLNKVFPGDFEALDLHLGYNLGSAFFELGYINSNKESKNLGTAVFSGVTLTGSSSLEFDGYRIGAGYNFPINKQFVIKPFINYYDIDITASGTFTATSGSTSVSATTTVSGSDQMIDAGLGFDYLIDERSKISFGYARTLDSLDDTDNVQTFSLSFNHQF
jgi:hypothetical protein